MNPMATLAPGRVDGAKMDLEVSGVCAGYGSGEDILRGVDLRVEAGSLVCLIGPNGAGKSTVLRTVTGLIPTRSGTILWAGEPIANLKPHQILARGICHVPQGRSVFPEMTVWENLLMGAYTLEDARLVEERLETVCEFFPLLAERRDVLAAQLSGGQQKMVELGRALMIKPGMMLLDEPSLGLEPRLAGGVFQKIAELNRTGTTILMVEQNARRGLEISDRAYVMELGQIRLEGAGRELVEDPRVRQLYLGRR